MNNVAEHAREQKAGMKCPQCGAFIETSIFELLTIQCLAVSILSLAFEHRPHEVESSF